MLKHWNDWDATIGRHNCVASPSCECIDRINPKTSLSTATDSRSRPTATTTIIYCMQNKYNCYINYKFTTSIDTNVKAKLDFGLWKVLSIVSVKPGPTDSSVINSSLYQL